MNIKIVGMGGIGSYLTEFVTRYISYEFADEKVIISFIDGDLYEEKNKQRQNFKGGGNKATNQKLKYLDIYPDILFKDLTVYIEEHNINEIINEDDIIFVCVDNHATRKLISDYAETLNNITIISGGNDYTDGNVQLFIKKDGVKMAPSLTDYHEEIKNPDDKNPSQMGCEELAKSGTPQLLFSNITAAIYMAWMFYNIIKNNIIGMPNEVYFDGLTMNAKGYIRKPKK